MSEVSTYSDAIIFAKAAKILRRHMLDYKYKYMGNLHDTSVYDSLPPVFLQFVGMIEHGADMKSQLRSGATTTDLAIAQLLRYYYFVK